MPRRSQEERTRSTRSALTTTARTLFAARGYSAVSADGLVARSSTEARSVEALAQLVLSAVNESALMTANGADREGAQQALMTLLLGLVQR